MNPNSSPPFTDRQIRRLILLIGALLLLSILNFGRALTTEPETITDSEVGLIIEEVDGLTAGISDRPLKLAYLSSESGVQALNPFGTSLNHTLSPSRCHPESGSLRVFGSKSTQAA